MIRRLERKLELLQIGEVPDLEDGLMKKIHLSTIMVVDPEAEVIPSLMITKKGIVYAGRLSYVVVDAGDVVEDENLRIKVMKIDEDTVGQAFWIRFEKYLNHVTYRRLRGLSLFPIYKGCYVIKGYKTIKQWSITSTIYQVGDPYQDEHGYWYFDLQKDFHTTKKVVLNRLKDLSNWHLEDKNWFPRYGGLLSLYREE